MVLTAENYYGQEANEEYMSVSQFKISAVHMGNYRVNLPQWKN